MATLEMDFTGSHITCTRGKSAAPDELAWSPEPPIKAAVIVVSFNSAEVIATCLNAVYESEYENIQVIVVDNGSHDATRSIIREKFPNVTLVDAGRNLGFAGGCNIGFKSTDAEIVVLLNDDAILQPDAITKMIELASSDQDVGIVGCKILYPDKKRLQHAGAAVLPNGLTRHYGYGEVDTGQFDRIFDCAYVTGAAVAIKRELLDRAGLFDDGYYPAYFEEVECAERARRLGYRVVYLPTAVAYHEESRSASKGSSGFYRMYHSGRLRFVLKNFTGRKLLGFLKEELRWLYRYGLKQQTRPLLSAYLKTALKLPWILKARRRDWLKERLNPRIVKKAVNFSESAFYNQLEGFSPILDWHGLKVRAVEQKAKFRLLAPKTPHKLGLTLAAADGPMAKLKVLADGRNLGEVQVGDCMQTLEFELPKSRAEKPSLDCCKVIKITLKPVAGRGNRASDRSGVVVKNAWME
ncbi:glycosyltransferase family 2 protein [bacterium]|nr:glycosyltransferase family 2 protein [bacterium]